MARFAQVFLNLKRAAFFGKFGLGMVWPQKTAAQPSSGLNPRSVNGETRFCIFLGYYLQWENTHFQWKNSKTHGFLHVLPLELQSKKKWKSQEFAENHGILRPFDTLFRILIVVNPQKTTYLTKFAQIPDSRKKRRHKSRRSASYTRLSQTPPVILTCFC